MTALSDRFRAEIDAHVTDLRRRHAQVWPAEVPREVRYPLGEVTVTAHLRHWAHERGDRPAVVLGDRTLTYAQLDEQSGRLAADPVEDGVRRGDRVAVFMGNSLEFVLAFHAVLKAGAVHVPVNRCSAARRCARSSR